MKTALIIGGGIAGCAAAHILAMLGGWDVTVVERNNHLGDGVRTHWWGGHPYTYGPRHFLTHNESVYEFFNKYCPLRSCADHQFLTYVEADDQFYNYPIHEDDIARMPDKDKIRQELHEVSGIAAARNLEEYWIGSVGETLYNKIVKNYNKKMWMVDDNKVFTAFSWSPKGVAIKKGPRAAWDSVISAYPVAPDGYNGYFDLATAEAKVLFNTQIESYDIRNRTVTLQGEKRKFDLIISTISPDTLFDNVYGELRYIGRDIHNIVLPIEQAFPDHVYYLYYANTEKFTRIVEYKKFTGHKSATTLIGMEIPSFNGKHYPMPFPEDHALARRYLDDMPAGVFSIGRNGTYKYGVDIDDSIEQALALADILKQGGWEDPVPIEKHRFFDRPIVPVKDSSASS